jgi:hypothetical protein
MEGKKNGGKHGQRVLPSLRRAPWFLRRFKGCRDNLPARHGAAKRRERFATRVGNKELQKKKQKGKVKPEGKGEALADETNRRRRAKCTGRINLIVPHGPKEADDRSTQAQTLIHARRYGREQIRARRGGEGGGEEEGEGNGALAWGGGGGRWRRRGPRAPGPGRRAAAARPPPPSSGRRRPPRSLGRLSCWVCFPFPRSPRLAHCGSGLPAFRA